MVLARFADVTVDCSANEHARCSTHWLGAYMKFTTDVLRAMLGRRDQYLGVTLVPLRGVGGPVKCRRLVCTGRTTTAMTVRSIPKCR